MIIELFPVLAGDKEEQEEHVDDGEQPTGNPRFLTQGSFTALPCDRMQPNWPDNTY